MKKDDIHPLATPGGRPGRTKTYIAALALGGALLAAGCADRREVTTRQSTTGTDDAAYTTATTQQSAREQLEPTGRQGTTMVLDEERLDIEKRRVQEGGVLIRKEVETQEVSQPVELRSETVQVERLSPEEARQRGISPDAQGQQRIGEDEVFIPMSREEAVVERRVEPREVIRAETQTETQQQEVGGTVRREVVDIERQPGQQASTQQASTQQGSQLEQRIRSELRNADDLDLQDRHIEQIQIRAEQGRVTLAGTVPEQEMIRKIEERVQNIQGVQSVENQLRASQ
jgi:stress response protein YsnF